MTGRDAVSIFGYLAAALFLAGIVYVHGDVLSSIFGGLITAALWRAAWLIVDAFMPNNAGDEW